MRSKPVVWSRRVRVGRLQATATSPPASRARRMPPMSAPRPAESMNGTADRSISRYCLLGQLAERLAELAHRVGVELTDGPAQRVVGGLLHLDVEHSSSRGRSDRLRLPAHGSQPSPCTRRRGDRARSGRGTSVAAVPDVLIATDADAVFDEVEAALADERTTRRAGPRRQRAWPAWSPSRPPTWSSSTCRSATWAASPPACTCATRPAPAACPRCPC